MRGEDADGATRRARLLRTVGAIAAAASAGGLVACSVIFDWSGFTSGNAGLEGGHMDTMDAAGDAGDDSPPDDGGIVLADAPPLVSCGTAQLCSPPVPSNAPGWSGPYALSLGAPGSLSPCDPSAYLSQPAFEGNYDLKADTPQCGCSCSRPQGLGCDPPKVTFFSDMNCTLPCGGGPVSGCLVIPTCGSSSGPANFLEIGAATPSAAATCAPDGSVVVPPASWTGEARVCKPGPTATKGTCNPDELCLPAATPYCIMFAGDAGEAPCPAGDWYVHRHVFYSGVNDQRGCTQCTCGAPDGATCSFPNPNLPVGSFDTTCNVPLGQPFFAPAPCTAKVPSTFGLRMVLEAGVEGGACGASAVAPLDAGAVPTGATTLCCTQ
jgi:hypothetical protein